MKQPTIVVVGSVNMDIVVEAERPPTLGETVQGIDAHFIPGGKGANQAVATARLGAHTSMIGAVGDDSFGFTLLGTLKKAGVSVDGIKQVDDARTGLASILVANGDNQIVVVAGANGKLSRDDIFLYEELFARADVILLQLEIPLETVCEAASLAKKHQKTVILNPAPAMDLPTELLKNVDYITPNVHELELLTGMSVNGGGHIEEAMSQLRSMGPKNVVTTLGAEGAAYLTANGDYEVIPSIKVPVVDTTGAGDCFNGALAFSLANGNKLSEAILFATKAASLSVTKLGAQSGMPTMEEMEKRLI